MVQFEMSAETNKGSLSATITEEQRVAFGHGLTRHDRWQWTWGEIQNILRKAHGDDVEVRGGLKFELAEEQLTLQLEPALAS